MYMLNVAIKLAAEHHEGQKDKTGENYILHPLRVMMLLETDTEKIVGVLHDILEDTFATVDTLFEAEFSNEVIEAVKSVTRNKGENYWDFIRRVKTNPIGRKVKLADLEDNMRWDRIKSATEEAMKRMQKYQQAYYMLKNQ